MFHASPVAHPVLDEVARSIGYLVLSHRAERLADPAAASYCADESNEPALLDAAQRDLDLQVLLGDLQATDLVSPDLAVALTNWGK